MRDYKAYLENGFKSFIVASLLGLVAVLSYLIWVDFIAPNAAVVGKIVLAIFGIFIATIFVGAIVTEASRWIDE